MNYNEQKIEVNILGKRYAVICPPHQEEKLMEAVSFLNNKVEELRCGMKNMQSADAVWSRDSLLAIIALNLSYELLKMDIAISGKAMRAEKLVERIKDSFAQLDSGDATPKISEISL